MKNHKKVSAILLGAGKGSRFGANKNKIFVTIHDKPMIYYALKTYLGNDEIDEVIVVINKHEMDEVLDIVKDIKHNKTIKYAIGGASRKESVYNGLQEVTGEIVIIHDGARPLIKDDYIKSCLQEMEHNQGATVGVKAKDTIKITNEDGIVTNSTNREYTWIIQTPQCFHTQTLLNAHQKHIENEAITDDCMLLELENIPVKIIEGDYTNIKVTTKEDIHIANNLI